MEESITSNRPGFGGRINTYTMEKIVDPNNRTSMAMATLTNKYGFWTGHASSTGSGIHFASAFAETNQLPNR